MRKEGRTLIIGGIALYLVLHATVVIAGVEGYSVKMLWPDIVCAATVIVGVIRLTDAEIIEAIKS